MLIRSLVLVARFQCFKPWSQTATGGYTLSLLILPKIEFELTPISVHFLGDLRDLLEEKCEIF